MTMIAGISIATQPVAGYGFSLLNGSRLGGGHVFGAMFKAAFSTLAWVCVAIVVALPDQALKFNLPVTALKLFGGHHQVALCVLLVVDFTIAIAIIRDDFVKGNLTRWLRAVLVAGAILVVLGIWIPLQVGDMDDSTKVLCVAAAVTLVCLLRFFSWFGVQPPRLIPVTPG